MMPMFPELTQALPSPVPVPYWVTTGGIILAYAVSELWKLRGQKKHAETTKGERNADLDQRMNSLKLIIGLNHDTIKHEVLSVATDVRDLRAHVIGPDGRNGLRGDVRELKTKVDGLLNREPAARRRGNTLP